MGMSAQDAGITTAVQPLAMVFMSGLAGSLTQRVSGKYLLIPGLVLLAAGSAYIAWIAHVGSGRWDFVPGLVLSGVGMGFIWTPIFALATRDLRPDLAGVASGVVNTFQELGGVIASAAVGALLQNRLAVALHDQAVSYSSQLPAGFRGRFVDGFSQAARSGFEVGRGQTGGSIDLPSSIPASIAGTIQQLAHDVFTHAFVAAMRPTMILPIAVILFAAVSCLAVRAKRQQQMEVAEADRIEIA
jgi:MFS family permease